MGTDEVQSLLEDANQDISAQIATDVVIIEDEPLIAMDLESLVQALGHRVVRVARTERQAIEAVMQTRRGLVLADIQLADGSSGLDAVNEILRTFLRPRHFRHGISRTAAHRHETRADLPHPQTLPRRMR